MGVQESGPTLKGLARRLEALERNNERMRLENSSLRQKVAALTDSARSGAVALAKEPATGFEGPVSRRALLTKAGAAAVAAVAAGTFLTPREAKAAEDASFRNVDCTRLEALQYSSQSAIRAVNYGNAPGVIAEGSIGVSGASLVNGQAGVYGAPKTWPPGSGSDVVGPGVVGDGRGNDYAGVLGRNPTGTGVWGESGERGYCGVIGRHTGSYGFGVLGEGRGSTGAGVVGRNHATGGIGVQGQGATGVKGEGTSGYGGQFQGGKAQLRIVPKGTAGRPTTGNHAKGEVYMDSTATLWVCTVGGVPGTWRRISTA